MTKKHLTRARILATATKLFKARGIDGVGLETVMKSAGLTRGGFYFHFRSKRALVKSALEQAFEESLARLTTGLDQSSATAFLRAVGSRYLTSTHASGKAWLCPLPTLGPEAARLGPDARAIFDPYVERFVAMAQAKEPSCDPARIRARAMGVMATAVGGIVLARLAKSAGLAEEILLASRAFIDTALTPAHPEKEPR